MNRSLNEAVVGGLSPRFGRPTGQPELLSAPAKELLNVRRLPAMLNAPQTAAILGVSDHDIMALVRAGLLEPLGNPPQNAVKYFAAIVILEMAGDPASLGKIRAALYDYWQHKNGTKNRAMQNSKKGLRRD